MPIGGPFDSHPLRDLAAAVREPLAADDPKVLRSESDPLRSMSLQEIAAKAAELAARTMWTHTEVRMRMVEVASRNRREVLAAQLVEDAQVLLDFVMGGRKP